VKIRIKNILMLGFIISIFVLITACGGGGGGGDSSEGNNATIIGTVSGTVVVAIDENNNEASRVTATGAGSPKGFTLTVPVGGNYRFYLIENEGTANEKVFFLYQDTTNVFNISSAVTIDLGFVDTSSGVAVPANNPLDVSGVTSGGQDTSLPQGVNDNLTPSIPTELLATAVSSGINLSWTASKDNVGVSGYKIYRDGTYLKSDTSASTSDTGLSPETQYCYTVSAYDAAGNESAQSTEACATTNQGGTTYYIAEYFPLAQGDTWTYRDTVDGDSSTSTISGTETINGVVAAKRIDEDGDYELFTNSNGLTYYKKYDADDLEGCGWSQSVFTPPITIPAEVSIGAKYTSNFTTNYSNCRGESKTTTSSMEFTVEGIEDVTVTAGTFKDCLKLKMKSNNMFSDEGQIQSGEETTWLAKGVGEVKSVPTNGDPDELTSATVGGVSYPSTGGTCINVAGIWNITENLINTNCDEVPQTEHKTYTFTQNGCNISGTDNGGGNYSGTVNGSQISMTGSRPSSGGITTITSANITVSGDGISLSGTASWIWSDGSSSCSGITQVSGTRVF
jgi:hypothetical protein